jgi:peptidoglycan/xylan/chitin deacetylase (PgdA/CDA1 family)
MPLRPPKILERIFPEILWRGPSNENSIYLTFDDGPDPYTTPRVLDILSEHQVWVSFFLVGSRISGSETLVGRLGDEGHLLANHGYSHRKLGWAPARIMATEIADTEHIFDLNGWSYHKLFRPPFGHFRPGTGRRLRQMDYRLVMWSLMPGDFRSVTPDILLSRTINAMRPGDIIVLHDHSRDPEPMVKMLPRLLDEISARDLVCKRLDEINGVQSRGRP